MSSPETIKIDSILTHLKENGFYDRYGDNALLLYALTLRFKSLSIESASEYLTDGSNDKKVDLVYINTDDQLAIIAQSYLSQDNSKKSAKANKAADLNSAISWLLDSSESDLPKNLQAASHQLRTGIKDNKITQIEIWYVHNLSESVEVKSELTSVANTTHSILNSDYGDSLNNMAVNAIEVGCSTLSRWYKNIHNKIIVTEYFCIPVADGFEAQDSNSKWKTFMTTIPLSFLYDIYNKEKDSLFSANVREYLGSRKGASNINTGIKDSVENNPEDFLIYNNGITLLTNKYSYDSHTSELTLNGISIINGAQKTTGAIGSVAKRPSEGSIFTRIVQIGNNEVVLDHVIEYNNKQNAVNPADFRSNDQIQKRLRKEFDTTDVADYSGGRRGGNGDIIKRNSKLLNNNTIAQILTSFMGNPIGAYQSTKKLWESNQSYSLIFNDSTNKENILFTYTMYVSLQDIKQELILTESNYNKGNSDINFSDQDAGILGFLRIRGSIWLMITAISAILPDILTNKVSNKQFIHFKKMHSIEEGAHLWDQLIRAALPLAVGPLSPVLTNGLNNKAKTDKAISSFTNLFKSLLGFLPEDSLKAFVDSTVTNSPK
ncbi:AIPR family protein [Oenococcus oeni]